MQVPERHSSLTKPPKFGALMDIYEENFERFRLLYQLDFASGLRLKSCVEQGADLYLDVLEQHRYTSVLRLSYVLSGEQGGIRIEPDVVARIYHDAQQLEVTSFRPGAVARALCGPWSPATTALRQRWRMNLFLGKWLEYLLDCGHGPESWSDSPGIAVLAEEPENITNGLTNRIPECPESALQPA